MEERFESLRRYGRLPRSRENRSQHLNSAEIAAAVLGLVPVHPAWAGHAAAVFEKLRPIGGTCISFKAIPTLSDMIQQLLTDDASAIGFIDFTLTGSGFGTNNHGFAILRYVEGETLRYVYFVSEMAVSLMRPGAEVEFEPEAFRSDFARNVVLSARFFAALRSEIEMSMLCIDGDPAGDGSEYDAEEARDARAARLGAKPYSRFLNIGIDTQVTWPKKETLIAFDQYHLVLMPKTKDNIQSVHIDLTSNRLTLEGAMTVINRFLSLLTWCDDQFAVAQNGWSGNPVPVSVPKRNPVFSTAEHWLFNREIPTDATVRRALGHYREARNADYAGLVSYAVLSYYKVIEGGLNDSDAKVKAWISRTYSILSTANASDPSFISFRSAIGSMTAEAYLTNECRRATAHASRKSPSDVDDLCEARRLHVAASVLRALARYMIRHEFDVSDQPCEPDIHIERSDT